MQAVRKLMRPLLALSLALVLGGVALIGAARAGAASPPVRAAAGIPAGEIQAALDELVDSGAAVSAVAEVRAGAETWSGGSGVQDLESGKPVHADGHFRAGSTGKTFVSTALLLLAEDGKLTVQDTVEQHLPGMVPGGDRITIRQLLSHTSGLPGYGQALAAAHPEAAQDLLHSWEPEELVRAAISQDPTFPPGQGWAYSNTGYVLAGLIIEQVTGRPYAEVVRDRVLEPVGLEQTTFPGDDPALPDPHAHAYAVLAEGGEPQDITAVNPSVFWAAGEVVSTTADLNRFYAALLGGDVLGPESLAAMRDTVDAGQGFRYGLGLVEVSGACGGTPVTTWGHDGIAAGYHTEVLVAPETSGADGRQLAYSWVPNPAASSAETEAGAAAIQALQAAAICG